MKTATNSVKKFTKTFVDNASAGRANAASKNNSEKLIAAIDRVDDLKRIVDGNLRFDASDDHVHSQNAPLAQILRSLLLAQAIVC